MANRHMSKAQIRECPIHSVIIAECRHLLSSKGHVEWSKVIAKLKMGVIADAIRWDIVRELIEEDDNCELIPLASAFFKRHDKNEEIVNPAKFLAVGNGKKTAGFAAISRENDHLIIRHIRQRTAARNGVVKAYDAYIHHVEQARLPWIAEETSLPRQEDEAMQGTG